MRSARTALVVLALTGCTTVTTLPESSAPGLATPSTTARSAPALSDGEITGTLFYDEDLDGTLDPGEPGLPGIYVSARGIDAVTGADGRFSIVGFFGTAELRVHSAWFRTQCDSLDCPIGPGPDNNVAVENQLLYARDVDTSGGAEINVGLIPDWDGETSYPLPAPGFSANAHDLAVRLSRIPVEGDEDECNRGAEKEHLCRAGDHPTASLGIHNQGTEPISDVVVALDFPDGLGLDVAELSNALPSPEIEVATAPAAPGSGTVVLTTTGSIPPGGIAYVTVRALVDDVAIATPNPLPVQNPYDRIVYARVLSASEPDVDSPMCAGWGECRVTPGPHDKLSDFDEVDGSGWNVATGNAGTLVADLEITADCTRDTARRRCTVTITNTGTISVRNIALRARLGDQSLATPEGWSIDADNVAITRWPNVVSPGGSVTREFTVEDGTAGAARFTLRLGGATTSGQTPTGAGFTDVDLRSGDSTIVVPA